MAGSQVVGRRGGPGSTSRCTLGLRSPGGGLDARRHSGCAARMVAPDPLLAEVGDTLTVAYHAPEAPARRVRIVPAGGDPVTDARLPGHAAWSPDRRIRAVPDGALAPGAYDVVLIDGADAAGSRAVLDARRRRSPGARHVEAALRGRRADRRLMDTRPREPVRLDRPLPTRRRPGPGFLPRLSLHGGRSRRFREVRRQWVRQMACARDATPPTTCSLTSIARSRRWTSS